MIERKKLEGAVTVQTYQMGGNNDDLDEIYK